MVSQNIWDDLWGSPDEEEAPIKSSTFNSITLAQYFQRQYSASKWLKGFASVNIRALAGQFAQWKKGGMSAEQVTSMIDAYMVESSLRGNNPGWQDFLYRSEQIAQYLGKSEQVQEELDKIDQEIEDFDEEAAMAEYLARRNR